MNLPARILLPSGSYQDQQDDIAVAQFLSSRGVQVLEVPIKTLQRKRFQVLPSDLPLGSIPFIRAAYQSLYNQPLIEHDDYPSELASLLHRSVWKGTFRELHYPVFVKPRGKLKRFTGRVVRDENDIAKLESEARGYIGGCFPVWFSEPVTLTDEHRVFILDGSVLAIQPTPFCEKRLQPMEWGIVVPTLGPLLSKQTLVVDLAYGPDQTLTLVETNPPYAVGAYGLESEKYFQFLWAGWKSLNKEQNVVG